MRDDPNLPPGVTSDDISAAIAEGKRVAEAILNRADVTPDQRRVADLASASFGSAYISVFTQAILIGVTVEDAMAGIRLGMAVLIEAQNFAGREIAKEL